MKRETGMVDRRYAYVVSSPRKDAKWHLAETSHYGYISGKRNGDNPTLCYWWNFGYHRLPRRWPTCISPWRVLSMERQEPFCKICEGMIRSREIDVNAKATEG